MYSISNLMPTILCMHFQTYATDTSVLTFIQFYGLLNKVTFEFYYTRRECKDGSGPNYKLKHLIAYTILITILQSSSSQHNQFKKPPLYTCTKHCQILDLLRNKTHQDTQTHTHKYRACLVYTNQIKREGGIQLMYNKQS